MADLLLHQLLSGIVIFLAIVLVIAIGNCWALRPLRGFKANGPNPLVSILVPARNETRNIVGCVQSLLGQDYAPLEILVLDDNSTDNTAALVEALAAQDARLQILAGRALPADWLGKHWACQQLAQAAKGSLLLFTDADTRYAPQAVGQAVAALQAQHADLVSALPLQIMEAWGEQFIVPLIPWSLLCFFPLAVAHRIRWQPLVTAIGQLMLFRRAAYDRLGGHAAVRTQVVDDIALAQRLVAQGGRWRLLDAGSLVTCRMYHTFGEALDGLSKNLFAAFGNNLATFAAIWLWLGIVFLMPPVIGVGSLLHLWPLPPLALVAVSEAVAVWALAVWRLHLPKHLVITYPITLGLGLFIAARSVWQTYRGQVTWKGRRLEQPKP